MRLPCQPRRKRSGLNAKERGEEGGVYDGTARSRPASNLCHTTEKKSSKKHRKNLEKRIGERCREERCGLGNGRKEEARHGPKWRKKRKREAVAGKKEKGLPLHRPKKPTNKSIASK